MATGPGTLGWLPDPLPQTGGCRRPAPQGRGLTPLSGVNGAAPRPSDALLVPAAGFCYCSQPLGSRPTASHAPLPARCAGGAIDRYVACAELRIRPVGLRAAAEPAGRGCLIRCVRGPNVADSSARMVCAVGTRVGTRPFPSCLYHAPNPSVSAS